MAWVSLYKSGGNLAKRVLVVQLIIKKLKDIHPYPNNPRKNDGAVDAVAESIRQCGYVAPIIVDEDGIILAGHTRYKALKKLGHTDAEVIVKEGLTEGQKRKYRLLDNKTNELADWDFDLLADELDGLDFGDLDLDWGIISPNEFGEDFSLPDGEKSEFVTMSFTLHERQKELIEYSMQMVEPLETFGNTNKNGNALYEVVKEWAEQRK